jgi:hypothetical protein
MTTKINPSSPIFVNCIWTERLAERREHLETVLSAAASDPRFVINWTGSLDVEAAAFDGYIREDATPCAGLPEWRAWIDLRRNVQTTLGSSRRRSTLIAYLAGAWNLATGNRLELPPDPGRNSDDVDDITRKHLLGISQFLESDAEWLLALEDDAIGATGWETRVIRITAMPTRSSAARIYVAASGGAGLLRTSSDPKPDELGLFAVKPPTTRTACAYLINRSAGEAIITTLSETGIRSGTGVDHLLSFLLKKTASTAVWTEPELFAHGSEHGLFQSTNVPRKAGKH